ncbi:DUF1177 domain-containing protein [Sporomusa aerivorans]|uniref:DUF1177 domain-containing protein n=1 Tax=Sporomusa aerivorans TaxID=204936 RepID=UPI00352B9C9F
MALKQVLEAYEVFDSASVSGKSAVELIKAAGISDVTVTQVKGKKGSTDFIRARIAGSKGKLKGGPAPTLGVIGRLGGLGARPERIGFVSDGDGALAAVATAMKLGRMQQKGDFLLGDVIIATHICPDAPTRPHSPVPFMDSPVEIKDMNFYEIDPDMDAILSIDTTKGNRVINTRGFAISPTVKEGYILRTSEDLLDIMQIVTGRLPAVFPITTQDITPYGNGLFHLNSIMQPAVATAAPVVGVAITAETAVPGCATGASQLIDIELAVRFAIEVGKAFTQGMCHFYDAQEFAAIQSLYGSMRHIQTAGNKA